MNNLVVGFDCGATHTRASVWKNDSQIFRKDDIPGLNFDVVSKEEAGYLIEPVMEELKQFSGAIWIVGMAGLDNKEEVGEADQWWRRILSSAGIKFEQLSVVSDIELVLWSGSKEGVGIGLIAGTGSSCVGRNSKGKTVKVGGMSHLLSDEGSGFSLGWRCLHLITKMSDGRAMRTKLLKEVLDVYDVKDVVTLKNFLVSAEEQKMEIARAAIPLLEAAQRGERMSKDIVENEIYEMVNMVSTVNMKLAPIHHLDLYLSGSLFKNEFYFSEFKKKLKQHYSDQKVTLVHPLDGALNMSHKMI